MPPYSNPLPKNIHTGGYPLLIMEPFLVLLVWPHKMEHSWYRARGRVETLHINSGWHGLIINLLQSKLKARSSGTKHNLMNEKNSPF